jgi:small subunit ribosomal protein S16
MLKLRLKRYGRKKQACYRIVATDSRVKRDGRAIEELGFYNPLTDETHLKFDRIVSRLKDGAQPTDTVRNIFLKAKIFQSIESM